MAKEFSSGILVYRFYDGELQVLLGKMGGPKYEKNSVGAWNIPKGHVEANDTSVFSAALREFNEETSLNLEIKNCDDFIDLGEAMTKTGKTVKIYAVERDFAPNGEFKVPIKSNTCTTEWPPRTGNIIEVPELSEAYYFKMNVAKRMIFSYQKIFLSRLEEEINRKKAEKVEDIAEQIEGGGDAGAAAPSAPANAPGLTVNSVFGSGNNCDQSLVQPKEKTKDDPGMTTSDIHNAYVLTDGSTGKSHKKKKRWPMFRRVNMKKFKGKK